MAIKPNNYCHHAWHFINGDDHQSSRVKCLICDTYLLTIQDRSKNDLRKIKQSHKHYLLSELYVGLLKPKCQGAFLSEIIAELRTDLYNLMDRCGYLTGGFGPTFTESVIMKMAVAIVSNPNKFLSMTLNQILNNVPNVAFYLAGQSDETKQLQSTPLNRIGAQSFKISK